MFLMSFIAMLLLAFACVTGLFILSTIELSKQLDINEKTLEELEYYKIHSSLNTTKNVYEYKLD